MGTETEIFWYVYSTDAGTVLHERYKQPMTCSTISVLTSLRMLLTASEGLMRTAYAHFAACTPHGFYSQHSPS